MAKQQQFIDLFAKYDEDKDGQIDQQEFINIITELQVPYQYPGTVSKIIRKLNYGNPDKETLNLQQAKEYYSSFESISKHQIWKARITLLYKTEEIKNEVKQTKEEDGAAPAAAPGITPSTEEPDKSPQEARISILVGQALPVYTSEIDVVIDKITQTQKVKPFLKLTITSTSEARAKQLEALFKQNFTKFFGILSQEEPNYADLIKEIHVNSMVADIKTTFFITTTNQEVSQYIQLLGEFFELTFGSKLVSRAHLKFEFDYDFQRFINQANSNFYDIFTRNCRLSVDVTLFNLLKAFKKLFKADIKQNPYMDTQSALFIASLFHLEGVEGDFEFQNSQITEYETESKQQIKELLGQWKLYSIKFSEYGLKIKELLQLLDDTISIEFKGGQWKANIFLRFKNFNKILLNPPLNQSSDDEDVGQVNTHLEHLLIKTPSQGSLKGQSNAVAKIAKQGDNSSSNGSDYSLKKSIKQKSPKLSESESD